MATRKKSLRLRTRTKRLGLESLEDRRVMTVHINELMLDPLFGDISTDQFVEIRNDELAPIPDDTYLLFVDGDGSGAGELHTMFNLSGLPTGSNGILTLLQQNHPYELGTEGHAIVSESEEFGGLPDGVFQDNHPISERIDFIVRSNTVFLVQSETQPILGTDIDTANDGTIDALPGDWEILDSISLVGRDGVAYSNLVFRERDRIGGTTGNAGDIIVDDVDYAARIQDSVGQTGDDWVVGTVQQFDDAGERFFRITHGIFGNPEPTAFAGRFIDHVNSSNFHGAFSGQVTNGGAPLEGSTVYLDVNENGIFDEIVYTLRPEDFGVDQELTNEAPRATLTVSNGDGIQGTTKVFSELADSSHTVPTIFSAGSIPWFNETSQLRIDFHEPASSVTAEFFGRSAPMYGRLEVFDASGESLEFLRTTAVGPGETQAITIDRGEAEIAYAVAYSDRNFQDSSPFGTVSQLQYRIPEQHTLTDADGNYFLDYIDPGTHTVRLVGDAASNFATIETTEHIRGGDLSTGFASADGFGDNPNNFDAADELPAGIKHPFLLSTLGDTDDSDADPVTDTPIVVIDDFTPQSPAGLVEDGDTLRVTGSDGNDDIHVAAGLTEHVITLNGVEYRFDADTYPNIDVKARGGADVVTVVGTSLDDQADLLPTRGKFVSSDYNITFADAETISVYGGDGGLDKAIMADSAGDDVFLGSASFAMMREINNAYRNESRGFDIITGNAVLGGNDEALVFGTSGSDHVDVFPEFARMTRGAGNTEFRAARFEQFEARGEGGDDMAEFVDSDGDDHITLEFQTAEMVTTDYTSTVTNFDTIHARATRGGTDSATFYDSPGDDELAIRPAKAMYMQGPGFENRIWDFDRTESFAVNGGDDESFLYDTAGNDVFTARPTTSLMRGTIAGEPYEHVTHDFETMTGHAMYAGFDAAFIYDGATDDTLIVRPDFVEQRANDDSFKHRLLDFQTVLAVADGGGNDTATFLDTNVFSPDPSNDLFRSTPTRASLEQPGTLFRKTAEGYETVTASSTTGTDVAEFVDVSSAEQFNAQGDIASLTNRNTTANGFDRVRTTSLSGQTPTADVDAVNFIFEQIGSWNNI